MSHAPNTSVARPMGRLMKKIQCQFAHWVRAPPASRPIAPPPAITNVNTLIACARSTGLVNSVTMMATITPPDREPPRPWRNRPTTSSVAPCDIPLNTEATVNRATPARKTFLRPIRSPARPATRRKLP